MAVNKQETIVRLRAQLRAQAKHATAIGEDSQKMVDWLLEEAQGARTLEPHDLLIPFARIGVRAQLIVEESK